MRGHGGIGAGPQRTADSAALRLGPEDRNEVLEQKYSEQYDLNEVRQAALGMGMVPADQLPTRPFLRDHPPGAGDP